MALEGVAGSETLLLITIPQADKAEPAQNGIHHMVVAVVGVEPEQQSAMAGIRLEALVGSMEVAVVAAIRSPTEALGATVRRASSSSSTAPLKC